MQRKIITKSKQDIIEAARKFPELKGSCVYGVPKNGTIIASLLAPVIGFQQTFTPESSQIIIDDLVDSGATRERYEKRFPTKPFVALFKSRKDQWLEFPWENEEAPAQDGIVRLLQYLNVDVKAEGTRETPKRMLKFYTEFLAPKVFNLTTFSSEKYDEMVTVGNIPFYSLCEHHLLPFFGKVKVSYIPKDKIIGLSKIPRVVAMCSGRLQNQERLTSQIADYLNENIDPQGVAVMVKGRHMCMEMRGIKCAGSVTTTTKLVGKYKEDGKCRGEFIGSSSEDWLMG